MEKKYSLKEMVYNNILDGIVQGEYIGGQIINEQELVKKYEISKSPIREALMILSSEGIVKNIPRLGYQVISFTMDIVENIMEFRIVLEKYALHKSFGKLAGDDFAILRQIAGSGTDECDVWAHWDINMNFHLKLASLAGNQYSYEQLEKSMHFLKLAYAQFYWSQWNTASVPNDLKNHRLILDALEAGDLSSAVRYLEADVADFCMK